MERKRSYESTYSQQVAFQKKVGNGEYFFSEKLTFPKCSSSVLPKSNCPMELFILKKWLLGRSSALKNKIFWKKKKKKKKELHKKAEALKK